VTLEPEDVAVTVNGGEPVPGEWGQVQYAPALEERVAALEALLLPREPEWTPEQAEEFRAEFEQRAAAGGFDDGHLHDLVYPVRPAHAGDPHGDQRHGRAYGFHSASLYPGLNRYP
jgi:hypothetical protein